MRLFLKRKRDYTHHAFQEGGPSMVLCKMVVLFCLYLFPQTCQASLWTTAGIEPFTPFSVTVFSPSSSIGTDTSREFEELEEELKRLMEELKRFEKETEEKIRKEVLPALKEEIEKLRQWLREYCPEQEESTPIQI
jgi:hypothetical protein